ncbi:MAG: FAD-dependent thymidylate synthase, partial [Vicinamibacterales bacterium]
LFGTGQAYEALLMRMLAHPLEEVRDCAGAMLVELREVIPAFLARIDQPGRGVRTIDYLATTQARFSSLAQPLLERRGTEGASLACAAGGGARERTGSDAAEVTLAEFDPDGETKVVAAALYPVSSRSDVDLLALARALGADERTALLRAYVGERTNRRHKPGRAFERTRYRFDVVADYGAFRDLQRHRMLTLEWQPLSAAHGHVQPAAIEDLGALDDWRAVMDSSAALYDALVAKGHRDIAPYAVVMAYRVRFYMDMNAREAMHVIELRTAPQGHPSYRRICQEMHRQIADVAGHHAIAAAMQFADHSEVALERLASERALEQKRLGHRPSS